MPLSTFLNARDPDRLRGVQFLALSDTALITRRTVVSDGGGGGAATWNTVGTAACRIYPASNRPAHGLVGDAVNENTTHFCRLPAGTDVNAPDRIVISGRGTFEVTMAQQRTGEASRLVEVMQTT